MEGSAQQWYYHLEKNSGTPSWPKFVEGVTKRFGPLVRSNLLGDLTHLRFTRSVVDYHDQFLKILARCEGVTEQQQIDIFMAGLSEPLRTHVELLKPETFEDAMAFARAYEVRYLEGDTLTRAPVRAPMRPAARTSKHQRHLARPRRPLLLVRHHPRRAPPLKAAARAPVSND